MENSTEKKSLLGKNVLDNLEIHPVVFWVSAGLILFFVGYTLFNLSQIESTFNLLKNTLTSSTGWFFVLTVNATLFFSLYLLFGRFGHIRLGGAKAKPEFSYWSWFSMLFSAGMGIGLLFYSVAEPIFHFNNPPIGEPETTEAAKVAMRFTFFHWGFHTWSIYAIVAVGLAFFAYNKKLPLTIRSVFYPLIGERIHGPIGNIIDILAALATLFGLATSLGLGVQQVNSGLNYLFDLPIGVNTQIFLIFAITSIATLSVVLGIDKGIRRLSELNLIFAFILLFFVLLIGPTLFLLDSLLENLGLYLTHMVSMGFWTEAYRQTTWQHDWTIFYWAWWISWAPFVGMFIARVSKGRTIREFMLGVLFVPTSLTFIWLTVFGDSALFVELIGEGGIVEAVLDNIAVALFVLLENYPLSSITSFLGVIVVVIFFVTSSDSASLVIDIITAGGHPNPPTVQRIFWAVMEGVVAAVLLLGGGLKALQTATITTGLPFAMVILLMIVGLRKGLSNEFHLLQKHDNAMFERSVKPKSGESLS